MTPRDAAAAVVAAVDLPPPQLAERLPADLGGLPGDAAALLELDHVVRAVHALLQGHHEHVPDGGHPLPGGGLGQVVVAVPLGLAGGVRDQLEDDAGRRVDVVGRGHDAVLGGGQGGLVDVLHAVTLDPPTPPSRGSADRAGCPARQPGLTVRRHRRRTRPGRRSSPRT